jgi:hypothetical protein
MIDENKALIRRLAAAHDRQDAAANTALREGLSAVELAGAPLASGSMHI